MGAESGLSIQKWSGLFFLPCIWAHPPLIRTPFKATTTHLTSPSLTLSLAPPPPIIHPPMYRPTPGPSTALYQLPPTPPSTPLGGVSASSPLLSAYDGMDDVLPALIAFDLECVKKKYLALTILSQSELILFIISDSYTLWSGRMDSHYSGGEQPLSPSCAHKAFSNTRDGRQTGPLRRQTSTTLNQLLDGCASYH